jgi:cell division protease FtsH
VLGLTLYRVTTGRIPALESKTREAGKEATTVTFDDVAGVDEAKEEVKEIVDFLREPERFSAIGGRIPKGVLLVGPPAPARRCSRGRSRARPRCRSSSPADRISSRCTPARRLAHIASCSRTRAVTPACIVFIDELDAGGPQPRRQFAQP